MLLLTKPKEIIMLDRLQEDVSIAQETDSLGGFGPLDSALYDMLIEHAYYTESKGGAIGLNLQCTGANKEKLKQTLWVASGTAKGGKNYYTSKKGEKHYLPGFIIANAISLLGASKKIGELTTEKKNIMLYNNDPSIKKEVITEVDMVMALVGKTITLGVLRQTVDKTKLNDATGNYEPTGETRDENEIVKVFRASDGKTVAEIIAKSETAEFKPKWAEKWTGVTKDKSSGTGAAAGAPGSAVASTGAAAPTESLFN